VKAIEGAAQLAVNNLKEGKAPKPFVFSSPTRLEIEFIQSHMADNAQKMPGAERGDGRRVLFTADDTLTIYRAFQSLVALAG
jgi:D-aminopeptidase